MQRNTADRTHVWGKGPDREHVSKTSRALGIGAYYLLVKDPARFNSPSFDESALAEMFRKNMVLVIELPAVTATTIQAIELASAEKRKHLTYA